MELDCLVVEGGHKLNGTVEISSAKNALLPIMAATLLTSDTIVLENIPRLRDIQTMKKLLTMMGKTIEEFEGPEIGTTKSFPKLNYKISEAKGSTIQPEATYDLVKTMRASILVLGPLLARFQQAKVSLPGGCAIGARPIDIHLSNLEKMNATIKLEAGYVDSHTTGLQGQDLILSFPSVGATENLMMAAALSKGKTKIQNCALEPEIEDLGNFLVKMGAKIKGLGTSVLEIEGVEKLHGTTHQAIGDRIEAATYVMAAMISQSTLTVQQFNPNHLGSLWSILKEAGAKFDLHADSVTVYPSTLKAFNIETAVYPGIPTDVQAQLVALALTAEGTSIITEHIFENRFMHVPELIRLGAKITLKGNAAIIEGNRPLVAAPVMCTDLRASAALVLASLVAQGKTQVQRIYHLERGYEKLEWKFKNIGAQITREKGAL